VVSGTASVVGVLGFWILIGVAAGAAVVDWVAVARTNSTWEYVAKPAVLVALTAACIALPASHTDLVDRRWWFVGALVCCLAGDVLLMLPQNLFVAGLAAFLVGHVLYIGGLLQSPSPVGNPPFAFSTTGLVVAAMVAVAYGVVPATLIFRALARDGQRALIGPVAVYLVVILVMAVLALNVGVPAAAFGAALFVLSDTILALNRFVRPLPHGNVAVHMTYHLAQLLLVVSLLN
jgi:uncharacterized membrane protein YhhN